MWSQLLSSLPSRNQRHKYMVPLALALLLLALCAHALSLRRAALARAAAAQRGQAAAPPQRRAKAD
jgi:hypothetical protein|eukprot:SAG25_NODE_6634_length_543_cov_0.518018_1_plen_66_part_00